MADTSSSLKNTETKKRRHSYSVSHQSHAPPPTSGKRRTFRWSHSEETTSESQDISDGRKRSKSFLGLYFKSKTLRRNSIGNSVEKAAKSSPLADTIFEWQDECIRVVITTLDPQMNYKTIPITPSTTAQEVIATLVKKFAITLKNHDTDTFYLTEVRESDQGSYSRLLEDNERVHDIQKRWLNERLCYFELCRKQPAVASHDGFTDSGPIHAIVLSPSQDSFSQECNSPVSLSEFIFPPISTSGESQTFDTTATSALHHSCDVNSPSDTSEAGSVDVYTSPLVITSDQPSKTTSDDNNAQVTRSSTSRRQSDHLIKSETIVSSTSTSKQRNSLDQLVQQSVRQQPPMIEVKDIGPTPPTFKEMSSPNKLFLPKNGRTPLESPKNKDGWFLKSLICSPVNPQGKTLPRFIFASSIETGEESEVVQHETVTLIKHGPPHRQSKTSRLLTEVTFETCLTIYPKFQTTASLFPSFAQNMHYNTEMNIFESLATLLEYKINQGTRLNEKVQNRSNEKNGCCNQHIVGGNYVSQTGLESDTCSSTVLHTSSLAQLVTLPANIQTRRFTHRFGMATRNLQSTMPDRTYSRSTTCISSEIQSDLDAVISQRRLHKQLNTESSKCLHIQSQSSLVSSRSSQMQAYHTFSSTELFSQCFSTSKAMDSAQDIPPRVFSNPYTPEHQPQALKTFKSLEKIHQQRQQQQERSSSEILLTFTNNQRPITVLLRSKSSTALQTYSDSQQNNDTRSLSSTNITRLYESSLETNSPRKRLGRPTSAPQQQRHGIQHNWAYGFTSPKSCQKVVD